MMQHRETNNNALFLGDLSLFCNEQDIYEKFIIYGEIVEIRIKRSKETGKGLSYGFIEFLHKYSALQAMNEMNGVVFRGRPLRIRWATNRANNINGNDMPKYKTQSNPNAPSIHVKFLVNDPNKIVTEESLRSLFSHFGKVIDCTIKQISNDQVNRIKGYGFVIFESSREGLKAATHAAAQMEHNIVDGVSYQCELSNKMYATGTIQVPPNPLFQKRDVVQHTPPPFADNYAPDFHSSDPMHSAYSSSTASISSNFRQSMVGNAPHHLQYPSQRPQIQSQNYLSSPRMMHNNILSSYATAQHHPQAMQFLMKPSPRPYSPSTMGTCREANTEYDYYRTQYPRNSQYPMQNNDFYSLGHHHNVPSPRRIPSHSRILPNDGNTNNLFDTHGHQQQNDNHLLLNDANVSYKLPSPQYQNNISNSSKSTFDSLSSDALSSFKSGITSHTSSLSSVTQSNSNYINNNNYLKQPSYKPNINAEPFMPKQNNNVPSEWPNQTILDDAFTKNDQPIEETGFEDEIASFNSIDLSNFVGLSLNNTETNIQLPPGLSVEELTKRDDNVSNNVIKLEDTNNDTPRSSTTTTSSHSKIMNDNDTDCKADNTVVPNITKFSNEDSSIPQLSSYSNLDGNNYDTLCDLPTIPVKNNDDSSFPPRTTEEIIRVRD